MKTQKRKIGGLVMRLQAQRIHEGWQSILRHVQSENDHMVVGLGVHGGLRTKRDPLTYPERAHMLRELFPEAALTIIPVYDNPLSNERWSRNLDRALDERFPNDSIRLYGSRDSFIPFYSGRHETISITPRVVHSGTAVRNEATMPTTEEGRAGIIHAINSRPDLAYSTVDVAILDRARQQVLLIGKPSVFDEFLAFPGGFLDPTDESHTAAAVRERHEEVLGIETGPLTWVGQTRMQDPRYRNASDGTHTTLFACDYLGGTPRFGDDAETIQWVKRENLEKVLVPWHRRLAQMLEAHW